MFFYIYLLFVLASIIGVIFLSIKEKEDIGFCITVPSLPIAMVWSFGILTSYYQAAKYQAILNKYEPVVAHYNEYVRKLELKLSKIPKQNLFTVNQDTPSKSLTEAYFKAQEKYLNSKKKIDEVTVELESIRLGLNGFVVKWVKH